tara:strand:- start:156 stop:464 length:309 start_codon:yes stop_codon:yes gene_type:complete
MHGCFWGWGCGKAWQNLARFGKRILFGIGQHGLPIINMINKQIFGHSFPIMRHMGHGKTWQDSPYPFDLLGKSWLCSLYVLTRWPHDVFIYTKNKNEQNMNR